MIKSGSNGTALAREQFGFPPGEVVGFSGSRYLLAPMIDPLRQAIVTLPSDAVVVVGACVGVDIGVAHMAFKRGYHVHAVVPADRSRVDPRWRELCTTYEEMPAGTTYRDRNTRIVEIVERLVACPEVAERDKKAKRSGTWMTVRLSWQAHLPVRVLETWNRG